MKREREEKKTEVLEEEHNEPLTGLRLTGWLAGWGCCGAAAAAEAPDTRSAWAAQPLTAWTVTAGSNQQEPPE